MVHSLTFGFSGGLENVEVHGTEVVIVPAPQCGTHCSVEPNISYETHCLFILHYLYRCLLEPTSSTALLTDPFSVSYTHVVLEQDCSS